MTANEPVQGIAYPTPTDPPDGPNQMHAMLVALLARGVPRFTDTTARDTALGATPTTDGLFAITGTGANVIVWISAGGWKILWTPVQYDWKAYTPTASGVTLGTGGTLSGRYQQIGKTINFSIDLVLGTGGALTANPGFTVPGARASLALRDVVGQAFLHDESANANRLLPVYFGTAGSTVNIADSSGSTVVNATLPWTWAQSDTIKLRGSYEAA